MSENDRLSAEGAADLSTADPQPVLAVRDLTVQFGSHEDIFTAVDGVSFDLFPGETLGVVGESGSGKSVSMLSILGLTPGRVVAGEANYRGRDLLKMPPEAIRKLRGGEIAMIFQDPLTSLNPLMRVGKQLMEALKLHQVGMKKAERKARAVELLRLVGVPDPDLRVKQFPFEFSGGMRQRVMIAMAIANSPKVLIADEPTTALDVTIQAQVLEIIKLARDTTGSAAILITHDLGVIAEMADRVLVMYAGRVVELATVFEIFAKPLHPYTKGLMESNPRVEEQTDRLNAIPGNPPNLAALPEGCPFEPRCATAREREICTAERPALVAIGERLSACHFAHELVEGVEQ